MAAQGAVKKAGNITKIDASTRVPKGKKPKVFDYSLYRITINNPDDFAAYLAGYPDQSGLCAYVYRLHPKIDLSLMGSPVTNIYETATVAEMTPEFIEEKFGRGRYMLKLTDGNRPKGQYEIVRTFFKLDDSLRPPVYDIRTLLVNHADNMDEVNRQIAANVLTRDVAGNPRIRTALDGPPNTSQIPPAVPQNGSSDLFSKETMGQVLLKLIDKGSANPTDTIKQTIEVARLLVPPPAAAPIDMEALIERVVSRLAPREQGSDMFATYEKVDGFLTRLRGPAGDAAAAAVDNGPGSWVPHLPGIISQIRAAIPEILAGLRDLRTQNGASVNGAAPGGQNGAAPMTVEQKIEEICRMGFQKMEEGVQGFDYAVFVCNFHPGGREVYNLLDQSGGAAGLMALIAMNPATRPLLSDAKKRVQIEAFLTDFFSYDPAGGATELSSESATVPSGTP